MAIQVYKYTGVQVCRYTGVFNYCIHKVLMSISNDESNTSQPTVIKVDGCSSVLQVNE